MADRQGSLSGLTSEEAREFHGLFMTSFISFVVVAFIAHVLVWFWRPWFTRETAVEVIVPAEPATSMLETMNAAMAFLA